MMYREFTDLSQVAQDFTRVNLEAVNDAAANLTIGDLEDLTLYYQSLASTPLLNAKFEVVTKWLWRKLTQLDDAVDPDFWQHAEESMA